MKKNQFFLFGILITSLYSLPAYADGATDKYKFGSKKGQEIKSLEHTGLKIAQEQTQTLKNILAEQQKVAQLLTEMKNEKKEDEQTAIMMQLIKELAKATQKQNKLLEQILAKTK